MLVTTQLFYGEDYVLIGHSYLLTALTTFQILLWVTFLLSSISNPG